MVIGARKLTLLGVFGTQSGMIARVRILVAVAIVLLSWAADAPELERDSLANIRAAAIRLAPALEKATSHLHTALILRDMIHHSVPLGLTPDDASWIEIDRTFYESAFERKYGHECGGRVLLYLAALRAFGVQARYVGLFSAVEDVDPATTFVHASTEVLIDGKWIAFDAHYNISLRDSYNRMLGWQDAQGLLAAGEPVYSVSDGLKVRRETTLSYYMAKYGTDLSGLTRYMIVGIEHDEDEAEAVAADGEWSGVLEYVDGTSFDVIGSAQGEVYRNLAADL